MICFVKCVLSNAGDFCFAEHNGKVLHLVQRLPAVIAATSSSSSLPASTAAPAAGGAFNPGQLVMPKVSAAYQCDN